MLVDALLLFLCFVTNRDRQRVLSRGWSNARKSGGTSCLSDTGVQELETEIILCIRSACGRFVRRLFLDQDQAVVHCNIAVLSAIVLLDRTLRKVKMFAANVRYYFFTGQGSLLQCVMTPGDKWMPKSTDEIAAVCLEQVVVLFFDVYVCIHFCLVWLFCCCVQALFVFTGSCAINNRVLLSVLMFFLLCSVCLLRLVFSSFVYILCYEYFAVLLMFDVFDNKTIEAALTFLSSSDSDGSLANFVTYFEVMRAPRGRIFQHLRANPVWFGTILEYIDNDEQARRTLASCLLHSETTRTTLFLLHPSAKRTRGTDRSRMKTKNKGNGVVPLRSRA